MCPAVTWQPAPGILEVASEHQALEPSLQSEERKPTIKKRAPCWCFCKGSYLTAWIGPSHWAGAGRELGQGCGATQVSASWWMSTAGPKPGKCSPELKPHLGGYFNPKLDVPHREGTGVCQPLERCKILSKACFFARSWGQENGQECDGSLFWSMVNVFPSKESGGEMKGGFEYPLLRKAAWAEHLPWGTYPYNAGTPWGHSYLHF